MSYCTVQQVRDRMGHAASSGADLQVRVGDAIEAASAQIDADTGRSFGVVTEARAFRSPGAARELHLPDFVTLSALKLDDDDDGVFETTIAAADYELDESVERTGWPFDTVRLLSRSFPSGGRRSRRVEVTATWGWAAVPAPINHACSLLVVRLMQRPQAPFGVVAMGEVSATIRSTDPDYLALIGPYRRPQVA